MTDKIRFEAHLHRVSKDNHGEVTLVLKVPMIYQHNVINLPEEKIFFVEISGENQVN